MRTESPIVILPDESSIVAAEVPSLALRLVTSRFSVSVVIAFTFVISPVVDVRVVIVVAAMVPPSTLSPLIWSSASVRVPAETLSAFPVPTVISLVAIVVPSIFPPFISGDVSVLLVSVCESAKVVTVLSIVRVLPDLFIPVPAIICPAPENCENSKEEFPISIVSDVTTKPESAFVFPFSTNEKNPMLQLYYY